mgnify:CR=1 FL=1
MNATYRIQFCPEFTLEDARTVLPYLSALGISDVYASPIFKSVKGSSHGYDVVDQNCVNPEIGGEVSLVSLIDNARQLGLGWLQDIVPNHMAFNHDNELLCDILEKGQRSTYASYFDIDWEHAYENIKGRVLAPFLGRFYGESLEKGELRVKYGPEGLSISYFDLSFPIAIASYGMILAYGLKNLKERLGEEHTDYVKLLGILYVLRTLASDEKSDEADNQVRFVKRMLWELYSSNSEVRSFLEENLRTFNGVPGREESFGLLDNLLSRQVFRLSFWKVATKEINYRRFFNINSLISLKVENQDVFDHCHNLIFRFVEEGRFTGLRVDHVDGLYNPKEYLNRIHSRIPMCKLFVEKILAPQENLPEDWPVYGSTGYDFANYVGRLFCKKRNEKTLTRIYSNFTGTRSNFRTLLEDKKRLIILEHMAGDINNLAQELKTLASRDRHGSDITLYGLRRTLTEVMVAFPVYRTYITQDTYSDIDREVVEWAMNRASENNPGLLPELDFMRKVLLLECPDYSNDTQRAEWTNFVMKFQQFTGPLMAKALEDTVFYNYNRLISLNEVGGDPRWFGCSIEEFHKFVSRRMRLWPFCLNATSTHDTKRGEDARARISVLSEIPTEWETHLKRWNKLNAPKKVRIAKKDVPDRNDEYFLYQALIGAFPSVEADYPAFLARMRSYVVKTVREAKVHTAWIKPDLEYEHACLTFLEAILEPSKDNDFLMSFRKFVDRVSHFGMLNSLSQTVLKISAPGVPDFYQGSELWDLNLVDPDNRRPVNFGQRYRILKDLRKAYRGDIRSLLRGLLDSPQDGRIKLFVIWRGLQLRSLYPQLFTRGTYNRLECFGSRKRNVVAFARQHGEDRSLTVVPRLCTDLVADGSYPLGEETWLDTGIVAPRAKRCDWYNVFTGEVLSSEGTIPLSQILASFPVGLFLNNLIKG